jgi:hypothetical protein
MHYKIQNTVCKQTRGCDTKLRKDKVKRILIKLFYKTYQQFLLLVHSYISVTHISIHSDCIQLAFSSILLLCSADICNESFSYNIKLVSLWQKKAKSKQINKFFNYNMKPVSLWQGKAKKKQIDYNARTY